MKAQTLHAHEDRLLDFAYGELPAAEARAMEAHLQGCPLCTEALAEIRGVRATMSRLSEEAAPDAGLESLLAYAQQAARHAAEGPSRAPSRWRRWLMPAVGLATVSFIGIISHQVSKSVDLSPRLSEAVAQDKARAKGEAAPMVAEAPPGEPVEAASPPPPAPAAAPLEETARVSEPKRADVARRELKRDRASARGPRDDWSNAGSAGGFPELSDKYKSRGDEGGSSVGAVQAIPPTPAARAELRQAPPAPPPPADEEAVSVEEAELQTAYAEHLPEPSEAKAAPQRSSLRLGGLGRSEAAPPKAEVPVKEAFARKARAASLSVPELSQRAAKAHRAGDRALEARLLRQALAAGVSGRERVALLIRLCDAEFALGQRDAAIEACGSVLSEAPGSGEAQVARKRLSWEAGETERARQAAPVPSEPAPTSPPVKR